ncbi:TPA: xylulokinase [Mannheimia haemolytica]|uniref:Xylulose kinase n=1 Tax=Mannheimia haemolytica TaxID=75985 RepID=A0A378MUC4_MANHA|nr:xylulokinase [Mannheimia haemolytica]AGI34145.1 xylulokinase [Mannheimia haemolytica USDA-ARS-USMARC-185]EEY10891.1 xylulokinase [Mannheimia haemolytica serotype A2 str. OVINE]EPZ00742.1 xylulokinase [Mannheimia haemolytica D35]KIX29139.1 xylulose kinase [Mannheimia haemolytica]MCB4226015.1 xylulokinase [Mannheimia haemolytica]
MYIGIDLGTSGVKVVLLDENQHIIAITQKSLPIFRPHPLWSEQNPQDWWNATNEAMLELSATQDLQAVKAIGLTGQMHGATLLDNADNVLSPAILWNDGRSFMECEELEQLVPNSREITGNLMMPGFTAPKLRWVDKHQPDIAEKVSKVLLPKDYLRLLMSGEYASDMSDASGTMWLDVGKRNWNKSLLNACGLDIENMPKLFEGNQITGYLRPTLAEQWKMKSVPIVAGGGDNAAGAIGIGLYQTGQAMLSLGTSGVYFVVSDKFQANPQKAVHSFCHALPDRWHLMSVILSAASAVDWAVKSLGLKDVSTLFQQVEASQTASDAIFLPYLSGERTPHNDPYAKGVFWGLSHNDNQITMAKAVIEGVSFALAEGIEVLHETGVVADNIALIGGGAKSAYWRQLLADISGKTFEYRTSGDVGPALGAAKLAQIALNPNQDIATFCQPLPLEQVYQPTPARYAEYQQKRQKFTELYRRLKGL